MSSKCFNMLPAIEIKEKAKEIGFDACAQIAMGAAAVVCDPHRVVISGRSKLRGTTIFATAKDAPDLLGPVATLRERAGDKQTGKAIDMALDQLKATRARAGESRVVTPPPPAGTARRKVQR